MNTNRFPMQRALAPCLILLSSVLSGAEPLDTQVRQILAQSGRSANPKGVCVVTGGELALAVAKASAFHVVAVETDPAKAQATAAAADKAGWLGRRFSIGEGVLGTPVMAESSVNLWVASGLTDAELAKLDAKAVVSQLAPHGGRAVIGGPSRAALDKWLASSGLKGGTVVDGWAVLERPMLTGAAQWTHRYMNGGNNPYSPDTAFAWPPAVQWLEKPYNDGGSLGLIAGGRVFIGFSGYGSMNARRPNNPQLRNILLVRDAFNGCELWRREGADKSASFERRLSALVATADACWLAEPRTATVVELDPASGVERRSFALGEAGEEVKWIAVEDGRLLALVGTIDAAQASGDQWRWLTRQYMPKDPYLLDLGNRLIAIDLKSGKELWRHVETSANMHESLNAVSKGMVYTLARGRALICLDAATGKEVWSNPTTAAAWDELAKKRPNGFSHNGGLIVSGKAGIIYLPVIGGLGFRADNGEVLWKYNGPYHPVINPTLDVFFTGGQGGKDGWTKTIRNVMTGEPASVTKGAFPFGVACGSLSQTPNFNIGNWGLTWDFQKSATTPLFLDHRNNCSAVGVVADGLLFAQGFNCVCEYQTVGQTMQITARDLWRGGPVTETGRLRTARVGPTNSTPANAEDWPTGRRDGARTGTTPVAVPTTAKIRWQVHPTTYVNPGYWERSLDQVLHDAPPIVVSQTVFRAGADGAVRALSLADGSARWTYYLGGRVWNAPTYWNGRILVGGADGTVVCLDAEQGRELWRYRLAPSDRRLFTYGHLVGTWPITTGITVHEGKAYAAAGLQGSMGTRVACLDAASGALVWSKESFEATDPMLTPNLQGLPAIAGGKWWIRSCAFDLKTGAFTSRGPTETTLVPTFTGAFSDNVTLTGGDRFWVDQNDLRISRSSKGEFGLRAYQAGGKGIAVLADTINGLPAWDDQALVAAPTIPGRTMRVGKKLEWVSDTVACWKRSEVEAFITDAFSKKPFAKAAPDGLDKPAEGATAEVPLFRPPLWRINLPVVAGTVLTKDHVLVSWAAINETLPAPQSPKTVFQFTYRWSLSAYARSDGKEAWTVPLPSQPLADGVAVARDGTVVVGLADGGTCAVGR